MKNKKTEIIKQMHISERTLSGIVEHIKEKSLVKNQKSIWEYSMHTNENLSNYSEEDKKMLDIQNIFPEWDGNDFVVGEKLETVMQGKEFTQLEVILSRIGVAYKPDIRRIDLSQSETNPRNTGYCAWNYILEISEYLGRYYDGDQNKDIPAFQNKRLFLEKFNGEKMGLLNIYTYPDIEITKGYTQDSKITRIINGEERKLNTKNKIRDLFHKIFIHYAKNRL